MELNTFNDLLNKLQEIVPDYQQLENGYSFSLINGHCSLIVEVNNQFFYVRIDYTVETKEDTPGFCKQLNYQGAFHELTYFYIYTMFKTFKDYPSVFMSVFFANDDNDLNILIERLIFGAIEYDAFIKNFLPEDKTTWDGELVFIKDLKNCEISVEIDKTEIPFITATFSKSGRVFEKMYTVYEWLLLLVEDLSWLESDDFSISIRDLPKPPKETKDYIGQILSHYGADITNLGMDYIDVPLSNPYVLKVLVFYNNLGIIVKLYTASRPFNSFDIKIPYRHDVVDNVNYLSKVLYLIQEDKEGHYLYSLLNYFVSIKDIYARILI